MSLLILSLSTFQSMFEKYFVWPIVCITIIHAKETCHLKNGWKFVRYLIISVMVNSAIEMKWQNIQLTNIVIDYFSFFHVFALSWTMLKIWGNFNFQIPTKKWYCLEEWNVDKLCINITVQFGWFHHRFCTMISGHTIASVSFLLSGLPSSKSY